MGSNWVDFVSLEEFVAIFWVTFLPFTAVFLVRRPWSPSLRCWRLSFWARRLASASARISGGVCSWYASLARGAETRFSRS